MGALDVVKRYYAAWRRGTGLEDVLADNLSFVGPTAEFRSAQDFIAHAADYGAPMGGIRITRSFECGSHASCVYEFQPADRSQPIPRAELFRVSGDRIAEIRLYYDAER